jgi:hypothetical protein
MGRAKQQWMERQQQRDDEDLARRLGITYEELIQTEWHIETDESNDGLIYQYIVYFEDGPAEILAKISGINEDNQVWLDPYFEDSYEEYDEEYDSLLNSDDSYHSLESDVGNIRKLNLIAVDEALISLYRRQLFVSLIGIMESYLSETFIKKFESDDKYLRRFVESFPDFREIEYKANKIFETLGNLELASKKMILDVLYHRLSNVRNMYRATFLIDFPDISNLSKAVVKRHDLVHRNGKTKEGDIINVSSEEIELLCDELIHFGAELSDSLDGD